MSSHQGNEVQAIVGPTSHELELAIEVILGTLASAREEPIPTGTDHTANLIQAVTNRLAAEPVDGLGTIQGVEESAIRIAKAVGATIVALAHLEASGDVLPFGESRVHQWPGTTIPYNFQGHGSSYRVGDAFNYSIAAVYRLPVSSLASPVDSPAVFLARLPQSMGAKVRRVLHEATDAYRARTYLGTVVLLATASEAAWEQVADALVVAGDVTLAKPLADPNTSAAKIQALALQAIAQRKLVDAGVLASLNGSAQAYRDLRNHAVHEPEKTFDEQLFARPAIGTLLGGAVFYFSRLYDVHDRI